MKNSSKTKQAIIEELSVLKKKIAKLEKSESASKKEKLALRESEARYASLLENIPDIVWRTLMVGEHLLIKFISPAVERREERATARPWFGRRPGV